MIHLLTCQSIKNVLYFFLNFGGGGGMNGKVFEDYSITFKNIWGGMNNFFDPPLSTKSFNDGGGVFYFTSIYKPNIKSGFSLQLFI